MKDNEEALISIGELIEKLQLLETPASREMIDDIIEYFITLTDNEETK